MKAEKDTQHFVYGRIIRSKKMWNSLQYGSCACWKVGCHVRRMVTVITGTTPGRERKGREGEKGERRGNLLSVKRGAAIRRAENCCRRTRIRRLYLIVLSYQKEELQKIWVNPKLAHEQRINHPEQTLTKSTNRGPYLNDVYTIFGILDPLPPCLHFGKIHK